MRKRIALRPHVDRDRLIMIMRVDLPDGLAEAIEQRATSLGTTPDQWLSLVIADVIADVPEEGEGPDGWICR